MDLRHMMLARLCVLLYTEMRSDTCCCLLCPDVFICVQAESLSFGVLVVFAAAGVTPG